MSMPPMAPEGVGNPQFPGAQNDDDSDYAPAIRYQAQRIISRVLDECPEDDTAVLVQLRSFVEEFPSQPELALAWHLLALRQGLQTGLDRRGECGQAAVP
jgi:hypothetical protein